MKDSTQSLSKQWANPLYWIIALGTITPAIWTGVFVWRNLHNFPMYEEGTAAIVAIETAAGTLTWRSIFEGFGGHVTLFSHLLTIVVTWLTAWDMRWESIAMLTLGALNFLLYIWLIRRTQPNVWLYAMVPVALVHFSLRQNFNWYMAYFTVWFFTQTFLLIGLHLLVGSANRFRMAMAAVCVLAASLSSTAGVAGWVVGLLYLTLTPGRRWWRVGLWLLLLSAGVLIYAMLNPVGNSDIPLDTYQIWKAIEFTFIAIGLIFDGFQRVSTAIILTVVSTIMLLINMAYIWRKERDAHPIVFWGSFALFAFGTMFMAGLIRATMFEQPYRAVFFSTWYMTPILPFWIAVIIYMTAVFRQYLTQDRHQTADSIMMLANVMLAFVLLAGYPAATQAALEAERNGEVRGASATCVERYVFSQIEDPNCFIMDPRLHLYNELAAYRLAMFAHIEPEQYVPIDEDTPILVDTHHPWLNSHIRDYFLDGVDEGRIYNAFSLTPLLETIPFPPGQPITNDDVNTGFNTLTRDGYFWYVRRADHESELPTLWDQLAAADYYVLDTRERGHNLLVSRVAPVPAATDNSPVFDSVVQLRAITQVSETVQICESISLTTFWTALDEISLDYSGSLRLLNLDGEKLLQADSALGQVPTASWADGELYADERKLVIPCDFQPGRYALTLGLYHYQTPERFLSVEVGVATSVPIEPDTVLIREVIVVDGS
jgi:hypothetical protein